MITIWDEQNKCLQNVAMVYGQFLVIQTSLICWSSSTGKDHTAEAEIWGPCPLPVPVVIIKKKASTQNYIVDSETQEKVSLHCFLYFGASAWWTD